jgi:error-prone DNA polymerase
VLTAAPITTLAPVEPARMDHRTVLPFDKDDVDALGLFKMDVLGLGMLTCIRKTLTWVNEDRQRDGHDALTLATIPAEDSIVYDAICRADTIGVFQIESRAQMSMLPRLRPRCFYDLVVEVALVRPGPIQGDMVHPYLRRRQGKEAPTMPHESLRPVLERTLGIPLFQEQVMRIAMIGANYDAAQADQLRRDMAAWKRNGKLERHREPLLAGFAAHGINEHFANRLYEQMKGFADYGFPESHAASFALLVYVSAWLKTHHPALFAAALLNSLPMGFYAPSQIVSDVQAHGVLVRAVDVNSSHWDCTIERDDNDRPCLRLGLRLVRGLAENVGRAIAKERTQGAFADINDLVRRVTIDKKNQQSLARAGALDAISSHRRAALWNTLSPRPPLLRFVTDDNAHALTPLDGEELLRLDYRHVGVSIDDHPMLHLRPRLLQALSSQKRQASPLVTAADIKHNTLHNHIIRIAGLVTGRQRPGTADGTCFITLEDEGGLINVVVWGRDFEKWRVIIVSSAFLLVTGKVERESDVVHVIAKHVVGVREDGSTTDMPTLEQDPLAQLTFPFEARSFR